MPAPATNVEFLDFVRKSGLIQQDRLDDFLEKHQLSDDDPSKIALALIQEGMLTNFQARQLLRGRYRGFAIGKYLLLEQLGEGGMGKVFLCEHMLMRRRVAIKVLSRELAADPGTIERFQREARAVASLDHPNIVRAHDVDCEGENHFIVMEYVDGISLHELVRKKGQLEIDRTANYLKQAAIGLQAVMDAGMIHRDIKPGNLLLDRKGVIKLLDLGLARFDQDKRDAITQKFDEGSVLGTADYLSPEQAMDSHDVDIRADIYSLGATAYYMLTGRPPFEGGSVTQKLLFHQLKEPEPLSKLRPDLPAEFVAVIEKMMAKDPGRRYQKPAEAAAALEPWAGTPLPPPTEEEMPRLCLAAQRAGTPDAAPLPNLPPSLTPPASAMSRSGMSAETPRSLSSTSVGKSRVNLQPLPQQPFDPRLSGSRLDKNSSSIVLMSGLNSGASASRVGIGESSTKINRTGTSSTSIRGRSSRITRRKRRRVPLIIGLVVAAGLVGFLSWLFFGGSADKSEMVLIVSRSATGDNVCKSVAEAWKRRDPKRPCRILLREKVIEENVRLTAKPGEPESLCTLEGNANPANEKPNDPSNQVVWKPLDRGSDLPLLFIENIPNLQLSNLRFEGGEKTKDILVVGGNCPRMGWRTLEFNNIRRSGLKLQGAAGAAGGQMMRLGSMTFRPGPEAESAVVLEADQRRHPVRHAVLHNLTIARDDAAKRVFKTGILITCPTDSLEFNTCSFEGCESGIAFRKGEGSFQPFSMSLIGNTFRGTPVALHFAALDPLDGNDLKTQRNTFYGVGEIAKVDDLVLAPATGAKWIWRPGLGKAEEAAAGKCAFRARFKHTGGKRAYLDLACDDLCTVWVNGKKVREIGPEALGAGRVLRLDVSKDLVDGENVLAILGENVKAGSPAGLLAQVVYGGASLETPPLLSGVDWRCAEKPPKGWTAADFNDSSWAKAIVIAEYGKGPAGWRNLAWDSEIRTRFGKDYNPVSKAERNLRDLDSSEGYPSLSTMAYSQAEIDEINRGSSASSTASGGGSWIITSYLVAGPFEGGFDDMLPPEQNPSPAASYLGKNGGVNWEEVVIPRGTEGHLNLGARYQNDKCTAYAMMWIQISEDDPKAELSVKFDDGVKIWVNGKEVFSKMAQRTVRDAAEKVPVQLKKGYNKVLVKVVNLVGEHGLSMVLRTSKDISFRTKPPEGAAGSAAN